MPDDKRSRIVNVTRKPSKCPGCVSKVIDIVYGTGNMTESDFLLKYRKSAIMREDNISPSTNFVMLMRMNKFPKGKC